MEQKFESVGVLFDRALSFKQEGNQFFRSKDFNKAKKKYHCALLQTRAISSRDTVGRSMSFFCSSVNSDLKYSEPADFKDKVESVEADCNRNLAMIFIIEEKWSKGLEYSRKALDFNENDEKSLYRFQICCTNLGMLDEAKAVIERLLSINPSSNLYHKANQSLQVLTKKQSARQQKLYQNMFKD